MATHTKIGDVFSVQIDDKTKQYFQYIINDLTQLNSNVIRVFKKKYSHDYVPDLSEIIKDEIEFYVHCIIKLGVKLGYWEKIGNLADVGNCKILFRGTNDYGHKLGEEPIKVSTNWYVWKINDKTFTRVGKLEGENQLAEIGLVINPASIVHRIRTGEYDLKLYPGY